MPYLMDGGTMGWMMAVMVLIPVLAIALIAALIVWTVRATGPSADRATPDGPLTILQRRYARGDLGLDEYERMRATLTKS
jgi:uncharacterized membrane protein